MNSVGTKRESTSPSSPSSNDNKRIKREDSGAETAPSSSMSAEGSKMPPSEISVDMTMPEQSGYSSQVGIPGVTMPPDVSFDIVTNDGKEKSLVDLIALKNIFSRQLPKMPKEYIVRLVLDKRHISLAIRRENKIIGGICYRPYEQQRFGEIAFCAISGTEQVRGFGTLLMNHLKHHVQKTKMEYFLTYADNYAIGYFQKQGFSKICTMPKDRWVGYIKDYDGGTLMECYIHPGMDYLRVKQIVARQRHFIYEIIKQRSQSGKVYPGLEIFSQGGVSRVFWKRPVWQRRAGRRITSSKAPRSATVISTTASCLRISRAC